MDILQALEARHAVRSYTGQKIEGEILAQLLAEIDSCNKEGKMHIQLIKDEHRLLVPPWHATANLAE